MYFIFALCFAVSMVSIIVLSRCANLAWTMVVLIAHGLCFFVVLNPEVSTWMSISHRAGIMAVAVIYVLTTSVVGASVREYRKIGRVNNPSPVMQ